MLRKVRNKLVIDRPNLLKEWDYEKNTIPPEMYGTSSNEKVWWICPKKHSYAARIGNRTNINQGCPYCSGRKALIGYNDFATWCHSNNAIHLLEEWDYEKNIVSPDELTAHSSKKVWWKCSLGHSWEAVVCSRSDKKGSGCPYCSIPARRLLVGFNDFETWCKCNGREKLLEEWNYERNKDINPRCITAGCGTRVNKVVSIEVENYYCLI